ncbi:hypothetical protein ARMGADRAFT_9 [Armillaria gallica]|uniref:Uncharacterized protein n=1 Tax=Armillaria gallica TaxID=47427 RepID=A0A2H3EJZ7_ARMGA|nr:hypothetical protein ARMGADRAFT_9 [Armillaria gallica]
MSPSRCFSVLPPRVTVGETGQSQQGLVKFCSPIFSLGHVFKAPSSLQGATPVHDHWITTNFIPGASREKALTRPSYPPQDSVVQSSPHLHERDGDWSVTLTMTHGVMDRSVQRGIQDNSLVVPQNCFHTDSISCLRKMSRADKIAWHSASSDRHLLVVDSPNLRTSLSHHQYE